MYMGQPFSFFVFFCVQNNNTEKVWLVPLFLLVGGILRDKTTDTALDYGRPTFRLILGEFFLHEYIFPILAPVFMSTSNVSGATTFLVLFAASAWAWVIPAYLF